MELEDKLSALAHFRQLIVASKKFHKHGKLTDVLMMNVKKVVLSDRVSCDKDKDYRYFVGYEAYTKMIIFLYFRKP